MFNTIRCGDRVTIVNRFGQAQTGRAVMFNRQVGAWVLNLGGKYGTPGLATEANTVKVTAKRGDAFARQAAIINGRG